jgi:hypothetical protein
MLSPMPRLYGDRISDTESAELIAKLRARGTSAAGVAADTIGKGRRDETVATSLQARDTILLELCDWDGLDETAPRLAGLRDRLAAPKQGHRIL